MDLYNTRQLIVVPQSFNYFWGWHPRATQLMRGIGRDLGFRTEIEYPSETRGSRWCADVWSMAKTYRLWWSFSTATSTFAITMPGSNDMKMPASDTSG